MATGVYGSWVLMHLFAVPSGRKDNMPPLVKEVVISRSDEGIHHGLDPGAELHNENVAFAHVLNSELAGGNAGIMSTLSILHTKSRERCHS